MQRGVYLAWPMAMLVLISGLMLGCGEGGEGGGQVGPPIAGVGSEFGPAPASLGRDGFARGQLEAGAGTRNLFGTAVVLSSDGALLVGEMAQHTANAGRIYGPCGSLDPADICNVGNNLDGTIDIEGSMARELYEETGLDLDQARADADYLIWFEGPRAAVTRRYRFMANADELSAQIDRFLADDKMAELSAVEFVVNTTEYHSGKKIELEAMPDYTIAIIRHLFGAD